MLDLFSPSLFDTAIFVSRRMASTSLLLHYFSLAIASAWPLSQMSIFSRMQVQHWGAFLYLARRTMPHPHFGARWKVQTCQRQLLSGLRSMLGSEVSFSSTRLRTGSGLIVVTER